MALFSNIKDSHQYLNKLLFNPILSLDLEIAQLIGLQG
jgi:hypothetical protein